VLFAQRHWAGLADGSITLAFRRWRAPRVHAGRRYRTPAGVLEVDAVDVVKPSAITDEEARRAGFPAAEALLRALDRKREGAVHRIAFHHVGEDPRIELRARADLSGADVAELRARLDDMDARTRRGPWTRAYLRLIADHPGVLAAELAALVDRPRLPFKADVRRLKELGLTESLEVGYRLSPRGEALLAALDEG
jgi:hypothetical protein